MTETSSIGAVLRATAIGGPTALLELGGVRLLTDPAFDPPGEYPRPGGYSLHKTAGPALAPAEVGPVDAVLLSHDHHDDNLDAAGRAYVAGARRVLTTVPGAGRLGGAALGLEPETTVALPRPDGSTLSLTAVHAQHGPDGTDHLTGPVLGFILAGDGVPSVYVSGDNASVAVVEAIAARHGPVDVAVLFTGAARVPAFDDILTLSGERAVAAARALEARAVVPIHCDGWAHFSEGVQDVEAAFAAAGMTERLAVAAPGASVVV
jgi:L-ascorbate metabolism protein UlaG (beta-lactamase superfamily)